MKKNEFIKKILLPVAVISISLTCYGMVSLADDKEEGNGAVNTQTEQNAMYVRGDHPRKDNIWLQYYPLSTALRKNVVISDVITPDSQWENWSGDTVNTHSMANENAENYDDSHNHYQNLWC